eukprot:3898329-Ditylum_brightwellii.AAC.1
MDEDSMVGRGIWAWLEHRACEARKYIPPHLTIREQNNVTNFQCLRKEQLDCPWGGMPCVYSFGGCFQLHLGSMKSIYSSKPAANVHTSGFVWTRSSNCVVNRHFSTGTESLVVVMDEVVRQQDPEFLDVLDTM